jgi:hypothetical protein
MAIAPNSADLELQLDEEEVCLAAFMCGFKGPHLLMTFSAHFPFPN